MLLEDPETTFVWGTNVNIAEAQSRFRRFIANFEGREEEREGTQTQTQTQTQNNNNNNRQAGARATATMSLDFSDLQDDSRPKYPDLILDVIKRGENSIDLDCKDLHSYDEELYSQLISYPQEIVPLFDIVMNEIAMGIVQQDESLRQHFAQMSEESGLMFRLQVRTFNLREVKTMRGLDPADVDHLISVKGMITHVSSILPDLKQACFKCSVCGATPEPVYIDRGNIQEPQKCNVCNALNSMILLHNRCLFSNKQQVKMQETPDTVPEGETPSTMSTYVFDDHVDAIKPGDRVKITGIFRALPVRIANKQRNLRAIFKTYVDVIHVEKDDPNDSASFLQSKICRESAGNAAGTEPGEEDSPVRYTAEEERKFEEIAQSPGIYERLVKSLAPSIWELDDVKRGILCQLFSGTRKGLQTGERLRSEVNVLLCGDPGTSKSQLMSYVHKLSPRGIYTSGRGSSSVGLTAYVARDPETRELVLESGALVLSDLGVCCIDEFDKMSDDARNALHEAMEQQTVSLAKAGIICTLNARASVLASANPAGSRYNPAQSVVENLKLPSTLLSRFDLIFLILDKADLAADRQLARHLVSLHNPEEEQEMSPQNEIISLDDLRSYILYAQTKCKPQITDDAAEALVNYYVDMRRMGTSSAGNKVITSTPRQLESLVRLSEALAKMKLASTVEVSDVDEAARLVKVALQQSATDPRTGTIDMDLIQTGVSSSLRQMRHKLEQEVREALTKSGGGSMSATDLLTGLKENLQSAAPSINELWEVLQQMSDGGRLNIRGDSLALA
jgi:DNA replication licensing factor MCM4